MLPFHWNTSSLEAETAMVVQNGTHFLEHNGLESMIFGTFSVWNNTWSSSSLNTEHLRGTSWGTTSWGSWHDPEEASWTIRAFVNRGFECYQAENEVPNNKVPKSYSGKSDRIARSAAERCADLALPTPRAATVFYDLSSPDSYQLPVWSILWDSLRWKKLRKPRVDCSSYNFFMSDLADTKNKILFFFQRTKKVQRTVISDAKLKLQFCSESFPLSKWAMGVSIPSFCAELEVREVQKVAKKHVFRTLFLAFHATFWVFILKKTALKFCICLFCFYVSNMSGTLAIGP